VSDSGLAAEPDRLIHEPARLKIMSVLSVAESADFMYLMNETGLTRGNLSVQLGRLRDAEYIDIEKTFVGNTPRTTASMTKTGHDAFAEYRSYLEGLLDATS
jgi:DNA-binding transcriptional ArsR family regulator